MKNTMKRTLAIFLTIVMTIGIAPLSGFVGMEIKMPEWLDFTVDAEAYTEGGYTFVVADGKATITACDDSVSGDVVIPATLGGYKVVAIGAAALKGKTEITSVVIPEGVESLDAEAFRGCTALKTVEIPASVKSIGTQAFYYCTALESFDVADGSEYFCTDATGVLYNADKTILVQYPNASSVTEYVIPDTVETIGDYAFCYCVKILKVTIPDSVKTVGNYAFRGSSKITTINMGNNIEVIKDFAFKDLTRLTSIDLPETLTSIGSYAFETCKAVKTLVIPDGVTTIGKNAFNKCSGLTSVEIGNGLEVIDNYAFNGCTSLKTVTIPRSVKNINFCAFYQDTAITDVYYGADEASWNKIVIDSYNEPLTSATIHFTDISTNPEDFTYEIVDSEVTITGYTGEDADVVIPAKIEGYPVTVIGEEAFAYCDSLESVIIPDSVTSIGDWAFEDCYSLTSVTIPNSVTSIGSDAFENCYSLTSVTIPDSVTSIGDWAFCNCNSLTSVTIGDSVTSIGNYVFEYCDSLASVTIPDSVTSIGVGAFCKCNSLTSVTIGDGVTSIGSGAFYNCYSLTSITVDSDNQYYSSDEYGALYNKDKTNLIQYPIGNSRETFEIPDSVTRIGEDAFRFCESLTSVTIPDSVTSIGSSAFSDCDSLTSVTIPDSVTRIGFSAFENCDSLTSVTIGDSVTSIGYSAFKSCESLTSITIPDSVTSIGDYAFYNCYSLTDVYYNGTEEEWNEINFGSDNEPLLNATIHFPVDRIITVVENLKLLRSTASVKSYKGEDYIAVTMTPGKTAAGVYTEMTDGGNVEITPVHGTIQALGDRFVAYQSQNATNPIATMKVTYADGTIETYTVVFELYEMEREIPFNPTTKIKPIRGKVSMGEDVKGEYILVEMVEGQSSVGVYKASLDGTTATLDGAEGMHQEQEKLYIFYGSQNTFNPEGRLTVTEADGSQSTYRVVFKLYEMDPYVNAAKGLRPIRGAVTFDADGTIRIKMTKGQTSVGLYKTTANDATFEIVDANGKITNNPSSLMFYMTNNVANITAKIIFTLPDGSTKEQKIIFDMGLASDPDPLTYLTAVRGTVSYQNDGEEYIEVKANAGSTGVGLNKECLVKYTLTDVEGVITENDTRYYVYKSQNPDGVTANINFLQSDGSYKTYKVKFVF